MQSSDVATIPDLTPDTLALEAFVSVRASNALQVMTTDAATLTLRGVAERYHARDFLRRAHVGKRTIDYIQAVLALVGLKLKEDPPVVPVVPVPTSKGAADVWTVELMQAERSGIVRVTLSSPHQSRLHVRRTAEESKVLHVGQRLHLVLEAVPDGSPQ
jgi:hypothetical protein